MIRETIGLKIIGMAITVVFLTLTLLTYTGRASVSIYNRSVLDLPVPGPYITMSNDDVAIASSFTQNDKILATFYFYWYDLPSSETRFFTNHPSSTEGYSWRNVDWHKQEILEMMDVGINVVLPVYWGDTKSSSWSIPGLRKLVEAYESLEAEGVENLPRIGMFYDTTSLATESKLKNEDMRYDLTQEDGKEYFYKLIRDFYSIIPPKYWAQIDGKPIVWLYFGVYASDYDQSTFDYVYSQFAEDFGDKTPYVIKDVTWPKVQTDNITVWGGALTPRALGTIVIGPGFDDVSSGRGVRTFRDREDGKFYEDAWIEAVAASNVAGDMNIIAIETWNEWFEATQIAESRQYGRQYLDITRRYAEFFFAGEMPPDYPGDEFATASRVELSFGNDERQQGISYVKVTEGEGTTKTAVFEGAPVLQPVNVGQVLMYIYFKINSYPKLRPDIAAYILTVEYYDGPKVYFELEYDSNDASVTYMNGAYKSGGSVFSSDTGTWKEATFLLTDAKFAGRQNAWSDFRIATRNTNLMIRSVAIEILSEEELSAYIAAQVEEIF